MRTAIVLLNAARWSRLAAQQNDGWTHVDEGWLMHALPDRRWDADLMPNVLMYNREVLVVLGRNGGCITHIFTRERGRATCISGTLTDVPWREPEQSGRPDKPGSTRAQDLDRDSSVMQKTVWTPNLGHVAADSALAGPIEGKTTASPARPAGGRTDRMYPNNFNEYDGSISGADAFAFIYQAGTEPIPARGTLTDKEFLAISQRDRAARVDGVGSPVIWHYDRHVGFRKTFRLSGRTIWIRYEGVQPGHVVANQLCRYRQVGLRKGFSVMVLARDNRSVVLLGADGLRAELVLGNNCRFTSEALLTAPPRDCMAEIEGLGLHPVMADNLELSCPGGGDFAYRIEL